MKMSIIRLIISLILATAILGNTAVFAGENPQIITVSVDGNSVKFKQNPCIINGNVTASVNEIAEAMGWEVRVKSPSVTELAKAVRYTDGTKNYLFSLNSITIDLEHGRIDRRIAVGIGRSFETEADKNIKFTVKPAVIDGSIFLGIKDLEKCLYATIEWDRNKNTVLITSGEVPYYDGYGLPNRDELFEQMRTFNNVSGTLTRVGVEPILPVQTSAEISETAVSTPTSEVVTEAPRVSSRPANILLPGATDVRTMNSYHEAYKRNISSGCNWYAYSRLYETTGIWIPNRYQYGTRGRLNELENSDMSSVRVGRDVNKIVAGSIAIYVGKTAKDTGHALFVEYVERDENGKPTHVYYTDSNHSGTGYYDPAKDAKIIKVTFEKFADSLYRTKIFDGYIIPN